MKEGPDVRRKVEEKKTREENCEKDERTKEKRFWTGSMFVMTRCVRRKF